MDRRRSLAALVRLSAIQHLQLAEARMDLAGAIDVHDVAKERAQDSVRECAWWESEFDNLLGCQTFDPEAVRRAGHAIMIAEEQVAERREAEAHAELAETVARTGWHRQRLRLAAIARQRRNVERKVAQVGEDRAAVDALSLATSREAAR